MSKGATEWRDANEHREALPICSSIRTNDSLAQRFDTWAKANVSMPPPALATIIGNGRIRTTREHETAGR